MHKHYKPNTQKTPFCSLPVLHCRQNTVLKVNKGDHFRMIKVSVYFESEQIENHLVKVGIKSWPKEVENVREGCQILKRSSWREANWRVCVCAERSAWSRVEASSNAIQEFLKAVDVKVNANLLFFSYCSTCILKMSPWVHLLWCIILGIFQHVWEHHMCSPAGRASHVQWTGSEWWNHYPSDLWKSILFFSIQSVIWLFSPRAICALEK